MEQLKKKVLEDFKKLDRCTDSDVMDIADKHKITYKLAIKIIAQETFKNTKCGTCKRIESRIGNSLQFPCMRCVHGVTLKDYYEEAPTIDQIAPNKPQTGEEVEILDKLLKIDLNSQIERDKAMREYGNVKDMYFGTNNEGEDMSISISHECLYVCTYQSNGWVRENIYYYDDNITEEYFKGKWK